MSQPDTESSPGPWYEGITVGQWVVLAIASAGWVFDVYEGQLFTIFKTPMLQEILGPSNTHLSLHTNLALGFFLIGGALGGMAFGILGDRIGRVRVMSLTILTYSIFSALTYFVRNIWEVDALRLLVALGTGGEWAIAAALVSETFPVRARTFASGIFHASSILGVALASLTGYFLNKEGQWRGAFLIGLLPSLLVVWIRMSMREPERWQAQKKKADEGAGGEDIDTGTGRSLGSLGELLGDSRWRSRALLGLGLAAVGLSTYWAIFAWGPELAGEVLGKDASKAQKLAAGSIAYIVMNVAGGLIGQLVFAPIAARLGRRAAFALYHVGSLIMVPVTFWGASTYNQALGLLTVMAFFVVGLHAGFAIYFPELFPTRIRATGSSFCFNLGRLATAVLLLARGFLGDWFGLRNACVAVSSLFLVGLVLLWFAPETRGQSLPE